MKDPTLIWFLMIMLLLWVVWFETGGPQRQSAFAGPFMKPPAPVNTGAVYGGLAIPYFLQSEQ